MQIKNFRVENTYAITCGKEWLDLHNDYDFQSFRYDTTSNSITFVWSRAEKHSTKATCSQIELYFINVLFLRTNFVVSSETITDANTLAFVGFLHPSDIEVMDGCLMQEEADSGFHMVFLFESGLAIKCFSEMVECRVM